MPSTITDAATLRSLFAPIKENPHDKKAKMIGSVMSDSGFAKPFLAYAMGQEMANAQDWDANREQEVKDAQAASVKQVADAKLKDEADQVVGYAMRILTSKEAGGPVAATAFLAENVKAYGDSNPYLKKWEGIGFPGPPEGEWQTFTNSKTGEVRKINMPGILEAKKKGEDVSEGSDAFKRNLVIVSPGDKPAPKMRSIQQGGQNVDQEWNGEKWVNVGSGPKWNPRQPADDNALVKVQQDDGTIVYVPRSEAVGAKAPVPPKKRSLTDYAPAPKATTPSGKGFKFVNGKLIPN